MKQKEFSENTLTDAQASAIIEAYKFAFPDFASDTKDPYVKREIFEENGVRHKCLFIFGNMIYFDTIRNCFVVRRMADGLNSLGEFYMEEDSTHQNIEGVIQRVLLRQLEWRMKIFFENEVDANGWPILFSSRFECAMHGRKHKEYDCE